jgi:cytochrome c biogenesis protein CcmG/thiol:disulfide interchange protein DsbE
MVIKQARFILPFVVFVLIIILLWKGLSLHPNEVPSPLVNKPVPQFQLPTLDYPEKFISHKEFMGKVTLLNVWASWCYACADEHKLLLEIAKTEYLSLYGLNYKDDPVAAKAWLKTHGNPYHNVIMDQKGTTAIDFGVYGAPESFLIDKKGVIRYKQIGPMTMEAWEKMQPLILQLKQETL